MKIDKVILKNISKAVLLTILVYFADSFFVNFSKFVTEGLATMLPEEYHPQKWLFGHLLWLIFCIYFGRWLWKESISYSVKVWGLLGCFLLPVFLKSMLVLLMFYSPYEFTFKPFTIMETFDFILKAIIIAPIAEEFLYRKSLYSRLRSYTNCFFSILLCSLIFTLSHQDYSVGERVLGFFSSVCACLIYEKTKVWWYAVAFHSGVNLGSIIIRSFHIGELIK